MKIGKVQSPYFKAAPTTQMLKEMDNLCKEGENLLHPEGTYTMFDFYNYSIYSKPEFDTGIGKFTSDESLDFIRTMKPYVGFDREKIYPFGRFTSRGCAARNFYCPYERGSFSIGEDNIDWEKLTKDEFSHILSKEDVRPFLSTNKDKQHIDYENELSDGFNYPIYYLLDIAYQNFQKLPDDDPLKIQYQEYKKMPVVQNYDRIAIWQYVSSDEPDLFDNFENDPEKQRKFEEYKKTYSEDIEFYKFNQFIAYKQFTDAKKKYNEMGVKIIGDLPIGNSKEEFWAFKSAFDDTRSIGYSFPMLRFEDLDDKNSAAYKFLKDEIEYIATLCDGVRLDVGMSYIQYDYNHTRREGEKLIPVQKADKPYYNGEKVTKIIEDVFREVKGEDFNLDDITYEAEGESGKFLDWSGKPTPRAPFYNRNLILTTMYENVGNNYNNWGYGNFDFYHQIAGIDKKYLVMGTTNHDGTPTRLVAQSDEERLSNARKNSIPALQKALNLSREFLEDPKNWFKAKMAELQLSPKRFYYYIDVLGRKEAINDCLGSEEPKDRFRYRITLDFEKEYNRELQQGNAFNRPEALAMALKAKGFSESHPDLYKKLEYFGNYLRKEGALTSKEADEQAQEQNNDNCRLKIIA